MTLQMEDIPFKTRTQMPLVGGRVLESRESDSSPVHMMAHSPYAKLFAMLGNTLLVKFVSAVHLAKHRTSVCFV